MGNSLEAKAYYKRQNDYAKLAFEKKGDFEFSKEDYAIN